MVSKKTTAHRQRAQKARWEANETMTLTPKSKIEEAIIYYAGPRCPDYEPECACCATWKEYDDLVGRAQGWKG